MTDLIRLAALAAACAALAAGADGIIVEVHPDPDRAQSDGAQSLIREQVEMGVAVRMAVLEALSRNLPNA